MKVTIISVTPDALNLLLRTKNTRLSNRDDDPALWSEEKKQQHLEYMRNTIRSSWEFVDYVFDIEGVTRAFTHQFVRTRTGSYAQQSLRATDARDQPIEVPQTVAENASMASIWAEGAAYSVDSYARMVDAGIPIQDARGILPTAVTGSIVAKFNLRTLSDMAKLRLCTRTQGEYQNAFRLMRAAVLAVHPWADEFLEVHCVATGTCAFPDYGKKSCPVYLPEMDNTSVREKAKAIFWSTRHEANPVAKNGKAM
jgi:flavin-dependent thymidylate synthase